MRLLHLALAAAALIPLSVEIAGAQQAPVYTLTFSAAEPRRIHVDALVTLVGNELWMSPEMSAPLAGGYATFVDGLKATSPEGRSVGLEVTGPSRWKVLGAPLPRLNLSYDVNIQHDSVRWAGSAAFARAYYVDTAVFFTGRTVFILSDTAQSTRPRVNFRVPAGWQAATALPEETPGSTTFVASSLDAFLDNANMAGRLTTQRVGLGELNVTFAGPQQIESGVKLMAGSLQPIIAMYDSILGGSPRGKLLITVSVAQLADGGEALPQSISMMLRAVPSAETRGRWAYLMAHEVFHLWNGRTITAAVRSDAEWFSEGFTDYMAKLAAYRTGLITEQDLLDQIARSYDRYNAGAGKVSLREGGKAKGQNFALLYYGGMTTALALDVELRRRTGLAKGYPDIMRSMYAQFGATRRFYQFEDVVRTVGSIANADLSGFFARYVEGTERIPLADYLAMAGLSLVTESATTIRHRPDAAAEQNALWNAVLKR